MRNRVILSYNTETGTYRVVQLQGKSVSFPGARQEIRVGDYLTEKEVALLTQVATVVVMPAGSEPK